MNKCVIGIQKIIINIPRRCQGCQLSTSLTPYTYASDYVDKYNDGLNQKYDEMDTGRENL